jgi:hypothetical protein
VSDASKLTENYLNHPDYASRVPPYSVDRSKVADFDRRYRELTEHAPTGDAQLKARQADVEALARAIFRELREQAADSYETLFLQELETQVLRELRAELQYYGSVQQAVRDRHRGEAMVDALRSQRHFFGNLGSAAAAAIMSVSAPAVAILRSRAAAGQLRRDALSLNQGPVVKKIVRLLNAEFRTLGVLDAVSAYMGKAYHVSGLALELSLPQADWWRGTGQGVPPRTLYAHLDESIVYPKSIVYLSDVGIKNGPTTCYPGVYEDLGLNCLQELLGRVVHYPCWREAGGLKDYYGAKYHQHMSSERFRRHFMRLPPELRFDSHMGWGVLAGTDLEQEFVSRERVMTGPPGTFIAFDGGRLFHRGGLLEDGERIVLQVIFGPEPTPMQRLLSLPGRAVRKLGRMLK